MERSLKLLLSVIVVSALVNRLTPRIDWLVSILLPWLDESLIEVYLSIILILSFLLLVILETPRLLVWNWRWHRFWYLFALVQHRKWRHLRSAYGQLSLIWREHRNSQIQMRREEREEDLISYFSQQAALRQTKLPRYLLQGEPGCGKTTALQRLTLEIASRGLRRLGFKGRLPVFVDLADYHGGPILSFAAKALAETADSSSSRILSEGLEKIALRGRVAFLFDAVDEVPDQQGAAISELKSLINRDGMKADFVLISSRSEDQAGKRIPDVIVWEIADLTNDAVEMIISAKKRPDQSIEVILDELRDHGLLGPGEMGRNPFWLSHMVERGEFSKNKAQILDGWICKRIEKEFEKRGESRSWDKDTDAKSQQDITRDAFRWLAFQMTDQMLSEDNDEVARSLQYWIAEHYGWVKFGPLDILGLGRDAQILRYPRQPVRFRHKLIHDRLSAEYIVRYYKPNPTDFVRQHVTIDKWFSTIVLMNDAETRDGTAYDVVDTLGDLYCRTDDEGTKSCVLNLLAHIATETAVQRFTEFVKRAAAQGEDKWFWSMLKSIGSAEVQFILRVMQEVVISGQMGLDSKRSTMDHCISFIVATGTPGIRQLVSALGRFNREYRLYIVGILGSNARSAKSPLLETLLETLNEYFEGPTCTLREDMEIVWRGQSDRHLNILVVSLFRRPLLGNELVRDIRAKIQQIAARPKALTENEKMLLMQIVQIRDIDQDVRDAAQKALETSEKLAKAAADLAKIASDNEMRAIDAAKIRDVWPLVRIVKTPQKDESTGIDAAVRLGDLVRNIREHNVTYPADSDELALKVVGSLQREFRNPECPLRVKKYIAIALVRIWSDEARDIILAAEARKWGDEYLAATHALYWRRS